MASSFLIVGSGVKTKWQYLRDTYRLEVAKTNQPTGSASGGDSKWKYFQLMNFFARHVCTKSCGWKCAKPSTK